MAPKKTAKSAASGGGSSASTTANLTFRPLSLLARARAQHSAISSTSPLANQRAYHRHLTSRIASLRKRTQSAGQVSKGTKRRGGGIDLPKRKRRRKTVAKRKPLVVRVKENKRLGDSKPGRLRKKQTKKQQQAKKTSTKTTGSGGSKKKKKLLKKRKAPRGWCGRYWKPSRLRAVDVKDVKYLQLLVLLSERAQVSAHELGRQAAAASAGNNKPPTVVRRLRARQVSRLRRAVTYAVRVDQLASELLRMGKMDARTRAELASHLLGLTAAVTFAASPSSRAEDTLLDLLVRRRILSALSSRSARTSRDQALYDQAIDERDPVVRYCAYQLDLRTEAGEGLDAESVADAAGYDDEQLETRWPGLKELLQAIEKESAEEADGKSEGGGRTKDFLKSMTFAGESVRVRNPEAADALVKVQRALGQMTTGDGNGKGDKDGQKEGKEKTNKKGLLNYRARSMKKWDAALAALGEAEQVTKRLADDEESAGLRAHASSSMSPAFLHQFVSHNLLSLRIQRDLLLVSTLRPLKERDVLRVVEAVSQQSSSGKSKKGSAAKRGPSAPSVRVKEESLRTLQAIVKLYDAVLQSVDALQEMALVQERDEIRNGVEVVGNFVRAQRCLRLAEMYSLLPTPTFPAAVQLVTNAQEYVEQAREALAAGVSEDDAILNVTTSNLDGLAARISRFEGPLKRAWFPQVAKRPVFYDNAFSYVDLPLSDLERKAGRAVSAPEPAPVAATVTSKLPEAVKAPAAAAVAAVTQAVSGTVHQAEEAMEQSESEPEQEEEEAPSKKSGWFGGLWGGRK